MCESFPSSNDDDDDEMMMVELLLKSCRHLEDNIFYAANSPYTNTCGTHKNFTGNTLHNNPSKGGEKEWIGEKIKIGGCVLICILFFHTIRPLDGYIYVRRIMMFS